MARSRSRSREKKRKARPKVESDRGSRGVGVGRAPAGRPMRGRSRRRRRHLARVESRRQLSNTANAASGLSCDVSNRREPISGRHSRSPAQPEGNRRWRAMTAGIRLARPSLRADGACDRGDRGGGGRTPGGRLDEREVRVPLASASSATSGLYSTPARSRIWTGARERAGVKFTECGTKTAAPMATRRSRGTAATPSSRPVPAAVAPRPLHQARKFKQTFAENPGPVFSTARSRRQLPPGLGP